MCTVQYHRRRRFLQYAYNFTDPWLGAEFSTGARPPALLPPAGAGAVSYQYIETLSDEAERYQSRESRLL